MEGGELAKAEKYLEILRNPTVDRFCNEVDSGLGKDSVTQMTVDNKKHYWQQVDNI